MYKGFKIVNSIISAVYCTALMIFLPSSCSIDEGLPPCPRGLDLHFVFDYHLEGWSPDASSPGIPSWQELPNAFNPQVHCYTLYLYNQDGELLRTFAETGESLRTNQYHLKIDLPHGVYKIRAYGGTACADRSFLPCRLTGGSVQPLDATAPHTLGELYWQLDYDKEKRQSDRLLHDFFYAYALDGKPLAETEIVVDGEMYKPHTLRFMRNTNDLRIVMQHTSKGADASGNPCDVFLPVHAADYICRVTDTNTLFDHTNLPVLTGDPARDQVTYYPWTTSDVSIDTREGAPSGATAATADLSVSRLMADSKGRIQILDRAKGEILLDVPLSYLRLSKPARLSAMSDQEYLDRQKYWNLTFIRTSNEFWSEAKIIINGWKVNLNDVDF